MRFILALALLTACDSEYNLNDRPPILDVGFEGELDIVYVFDTSGSMNSDWGVVNFGLQTAVEELASLERADVQLAITTADQVDSVWYTSKAWSSFNVSTSSDPVWDYVLTSSEVKRRGKGGEAPYAASIESYEYHPEFFRPGAVQIFVLVTDEPDRSKHYDDPYDLPWTVDEFQNSLDIDALVVSITGPEDLSTAQIACTEYSVPGHYQISELVIDICVRERWSLVEQLGLSF